MDLEIILSQTEKDKYHMLPLMCGIPPSPAQMIQMNLFTKQKQTHKLRKQIYSYQRGKRGRDKLGDWD